MSGLENNKRISHNNTMANLKHTVTYHISLLMISNFLLLTLFSQTIRAEKIKVTKVKGKHAIVESSSPLEEGQTYELQLEPVSQNVDYKSSAFKSRKNSLTFGTQLDILRSDTYQSNSYTLQTRYGWNFSSFELGAFLNASSTDLGAGATTTVLVGGYYDHNLVPNRDPAKMIYGVLSLLGAGSTSYPSTSASGGSSTTLMANVGGFVSYFMDNNSMALRGELYGTYQRIITTTQQNTIAGAGARGLLLFYF